MSQHFRHESNGSIRPQTTECLSQSANAPTHHTTTSPSHYPTIVWAFEPPYPYAISHVVLILQSLHQTVSTTVLQK